VTNPIGRQRLSSLATNRAAEATSSTSPRRPSGVRARRLAAVAGGFPKYREHCAAAASNGYRDFRFERSRSAVAL
jgi:hypothetical protein